MTQTSIRTGGVRFGKYVLLDRLAVGGMAEIFLARQEGMEGFEKTVVIKRIRPHLSKQKSFVDMFLDEARLAAQLSHPNIVQIHELGQVGDSYFIAMEYVFGRDMARIIPKAERMGIAFPHVYALQIASEICEALYYAHQRSDAWGNPLHIVHRDVTPENVFVSFDGAVKILDFGIAKARGQTGQTTAGEIKGKLSYMSPEQALANPLDCRSDIFTLGVVLYEWLTGFRLFTGDSEVAVLRSISEGKIYGALWRRTGRSVTPLPGTCSGIWTECWGRASSGLPACTWRISSGSCSPTSWRPSGPGSPAPPRSWMPSRMPRRCRRSSSGFGWRTPTDRPWRWWPRSTGSPWRSWPETCCEAG
jgi:serine/threonine protein kinase